MIDIIKRIKFTKNHVLDRDLIISMLRYEDYIMLSKIGIDINLEFKHQKDLSAIFTIHRLVLDKFNFTNDDDSVLLYRTIFKTYYNNPNDYDKEVINSVAYMRNNKCIFYKKRVLDIGDEYIDCPIYNLETKTTIKLSDLIDISYNYTFFAAFSGS